MIKVTCDKCGVEMKDHRIPPLPAIHFSLGTPYDFRACDRDSEIEIRCVCLFNTTGVHFCEDCLLTAFYKGVQDEFLRRQKAQETHTKSDAASSYDMQPRRHLGVVAGETGKATTEIIQPS